MLCLLRFQLKMRLFRACNETETYHLLKKKRVKLDFKNKSSTVLSFFSCATVQGASTLCKKQALRNQKPSF